MAVSVITTHAIAPHWLERRQLTGLEACISPPTLAHFNIARTARRSPSRERRTAVQKKQGTAAQYADFVSCRISD
jgi:hypothetical protein